MSQETQPIRIETGEEVAFELMKFIAEKENKRISTGRNPRLLSGFICRMRFGGL